MLHRVPEARAARRADALIRVSRVGDRAGDSFVSPLEQLRTVRQACERERLQLGQVFEELDVSGGLPLDKRPKLSEALRRIEAGQTDVLVVAYFDRFFRKLRVQEEVVERVEAAGGMLLAVDVGEVSARTASRWLTSSMLGLVAEYHRRITGEKTAEARADAIARGVPTFPTVIPGYRRGADGRLVPEEAEAEAVREVFSMRARGVSLFECRDFLRDHGIPRSYRSTQSLLRSRVVLGELRSGEYVNKQAHTPIVDALLWQRVQNTRLPRGPRGPSQRILARLGVLRCATCGASMGVTYGYHSKQDTRRYWKYHCGNKECSGRAMISAAVIEDAVVAWVKDALAGYTETATIDAHVAEAEADLERAQAQLNSAVLAFAGIDAEVVNLRLQALQSDVQQADHRLAELRRAAAPARVVNASGDWDRLTVAERRDLIRAVVAHVSVRPGRGSPRFEIFSQ